MEIRIEEKKKFLHFHAEEFGEKEMSSLVKHYENRKREHQLEGFNQCCIHVILCLFCFCLTCPDVLRCNPARLGIRLQIVLVRGFLYERSLPHRVCYHIAHLQEADTVFQKGTIDDFVSRIDNARHVSAFMQGFIRQSEITETTGVRLLESERAYPEQVQTFERTL